jgi:hypothetical protein
MKLPIYRSRETSDCRLVKIARNRRNLDLWSRNRRSFQIRNDLIESLSSFIVNGQMIFDHRYSTHRERPGNGGGLCESGGHILDRDPPNEEAYSVHSLTASRALLKS